MNLLAHVESVDTALFLFINNHFHFHILNDNMRALTYLGNGWVVYWPTLVSLYWWGRRRFRESFAILFLTQAIPGAVVIALKRLVDRPRPVVTLARQIAAGSVHVVVLGRHLTSYSFPSGHTETAFALAVALAYFVPRKRAVFYTLAALVGFSRVYNGEHFPLDVICGGLIGYGCARLGLLVFEKLMKPLAIPQADEAQELSAK
ncbi:Phosphatidic acid phosphatase type 2/haloperoxidase [mine drainage metagenome]|uniref:Phosphatidic acid phosphatase type 2/haloperoxidase n=1 Tax=mine drainage metagenome TaxID=410659 RepID=T0ZA11_9ZZZZ